METFDAKPKFTAKFVSESVGGDLHANEDTSVCGVAIDSRKIKDGDLFVAIPGQQVDGHDYVLTALQNGASCVMVSKGIDPSLPHISVDDTTVALGKLASAYRSTLSPLTVGVTGSVGKTTTKQLIASVLSQAFFTHRTEGNYNNHLGLPLTLLSLTTEHRAAVIEMGMSARGEIAYLSRMAKPDIGVITCIGTSHIENLGSREGIRDAKMEIRLGMNENGTLVLNGDEPLLSGIDEAVYVGMNPQGKRIRRIENIRTDEEGSFFDLSNGDVILYHDLYIPAIGNHIVTDAAIAATVGEIAGLSEAQIKMGLSQFENTGMRQRIEKENGITLITDCYNAAPESMKAALNVLRMLGGEGRKIAVLGDMLELGSFSEELHYQVGMYAATRGVDMLITFGPLSKSLAEGALDAGMSSESIHIFDSTDDASLPATLLKSLLKEGDTVLFKASRGTALERIIKEYKEN